MGNALFARALVWAVGASALVACSFAPPGASEARDREAAGDDPESSVAARTAPTGVGGALGPDEVRVVLKRGQCSLANPSGKTGTWLIDTPFPSAPAAVRRSFCSYVWAPKEPGAAPELGPLELTHAERDGIHLAALDCGLGECKVPALETEELSARETTTGAPSPLGGGGGCPACGSAIRGLSYFIYLHHSVPGERVALLRRDALGKVEDLGTVTVPPYQAFSVRYRAAAALGGPDALEALASVCLAPVFGDVRPTACPAPSRN